MVKTLQVTQLFSQYDLEERTAQFGEAVITMCKTLGDNMVVAPIIRQIVKSSTGIGAKYTKARTTNSRKILLRQLEICQKEAQEAKHWLRMLRRCCPKKKVKIAELKRECHRLDLIFEKLVKDLERENLKQLREAKNKKLVFRY